MVIYEKAGMPLESTAILYATFGCEESSNHVFFYGSYRAIA